MVTKELTAGRSPRIGMGTTALAIFQKHTLLAVKDSSRRRCKEPWKFARKYLFRLLRDSSDNIRGARDVVNEARILSHRQRAFIDVA